MADWLKAKRWFIYALLLLAVLIWAGSKTFAAGKNGFDLDNASIPVDSILPGGPPRDGIPAINEPKFVSAAEADFLKPQDRILGVSRTGISKAYSIGVLNWHEIVNDTFANEGIVITFCPLCGTGMAFKASIGGTNRSFGVSGLLYNSDVLLYDRESESLWSQLMTSAVSGPMLGTKLEMVAVSHTSWADWRQRHPGTLVLSIDTGHARNYQRDPYAGYEKSDSTIFPYANRDNRFHPKELVIGLQLEGAFKAYPFVELGKATAPFNDKLAGQVLTVEYSTEHRSGRVLDASGTEIPTVIAFWFAWHAFHPETEVYTAR